MPGRARALTERGASDQERGIKPPPGCVLAAPALPAEVEAWLGWLASQRRAAPTTLQAYRRDLEALLRLADGRALATLVASDIRRCVGRLHGEGLGGRSIARHLSAWRGLYRWLARHHGLQANPVDGIRAPKSAVNLPRALSGSVICPLATSSRITACAC